MLSGLGVLNATVTNMDLTKLTNDQLSAFLNSGTITSEQYKSELTRRAQLVTKGRGGPLTGNDLAVFNAGISQVAAIAAANKAMILTNQAQALQNQIKSFSGLPNPTQSSIEVIKKLQIKVNALKSDAAKAVYPTLTRDQQIKLFNTSNEAVKNSLVAAYGNQNEPYNSPPAANTSSGKIFGIDSNYILLFGTGIAVFLYLNRKKK